MELSLIPSCSSSSSAPQLKHYVFLSFRGEDTRYNFTSHLYEALRRKGIETYIDDQLNRGDEISPSLLKAIEESQVSVIIFSKDYASSRWCLDELMKILECKQRYEQIVIPVFYNVNPSDVRNQTGTYGDAFTKHEERFNKSLDKVQRWKDALKEAADLSGWPSSDNKSESELIEEIVLDISKRLNNMSPSDNNDLVGMASRIEQIVSLLCSGSEDVRSLGIWGIGGIGKTTLARAVFNKISRQFDGSYFIENVRERSEQKAEFDRLRQELLSTVLEDANMKSIGTSGVGRAFTRDRLGRKKLLIVFDDTSNFSQIEFLIGGLDCLNSKSLIIITTRDRRVLKNCGVNHIYEVKELPSCDALQLFCRYAFKTKHPAVAYADLSKRIAKYAGGLPLALKILGSFLHDNSKQEWESAMSKLESIPNKDIQKVMQISYEGLDDEQQQIFLDIACFFKGNKKDFVINTLNANGFSGETGVRVLIDKSLIFLSYDNMIMMHDLIQAMAREIVRQESIRNPGERSRLWHHEDIYRVLTKKMGTKVVEGISLDMSKIEDLFLNQHAFVNMHQLRFLKFYNSSYEKNANKVHGFLSLESDFDELRYLSWYKYPFKSLPSRFHLESLVTLEMHYSRVEQLWNGVQNLGSLKEVDLSFSEHLTNWADFSSFPNLERLILKCCTNLREIPSSIQYLSKLNFLDLTNCTRLTSLPDCSGLTSLRKLVLSYCSNLKMLPEMPCDIEELRLTGTAIEQLPSSLENLSRLVILDLNHCSWLKSLPSSICKWKSLECLCLSDCSKLDKLPDDIGTLKSLRQLRVEGTGIRVVPSSIVYLSNLSELSFRRCEGLLLPPLLGLHNLGELDLADCCITEIPDSVGCLSSLKILNLGGNRLKSLPDSVGCLSSLEILNLGGNMLESIPASFVNLSNLQSLDISFRRMLLSAHHVEVISIRERKSLLEILQQVAGRIAPRYFRCTKCFKLDRNFLKDIVEDALPKILPKIQGLATLLKEEYRDKDFEDAPSFAHICYLGRKVPKWFNFQSSGSLIKVALPSDWSNNFVGFMLCTVAEFLEDDTQYILSIACRYTSSYGHVVNEFFVDTSYIEYPYKSKHLIIGFDSRFFPHHISESLSCSTEVSFRFRLRNSSNKHAKRNMDHTVEKCGVRLMYNQRHHDRSDGSFCTGEERDETNQECNMVTEYFEKNCYSILRSFSTDQEMQGDRWKITFEKGRDVKICEDGEGLEWIVDVDPWSGGTSRRLTNWAELLQAHRMRALLKQEKEEMEAPKKQAEALQLSQLIQLLYSTEIIARPQNEGTATYYLQYPIEALICPLCNELLTDPVEISCGHSFERKAILEHFKGGEKNCPTCGEELSSLDLTPNISLRSSIQEWKKREMELRFQAAIPEINSGDHSRQNRALEHVQSLIHIPKYAEKAAEEGLIPKLVEFLKDKRLNIKATLKCLYCLAEYSDDYKDAISEAGAVRQVVKQIYKGETESDAKSDAIAVLLELSKIETIGEKIGKTKDCIPVLVSLLRNDNPNVSQKAHNVLQNLSSNTHFAVKMAEAGYFPPFVACFNQGVQETRALMAAAFTKMELKENSIKDLKDRQFIHNMIQMLSSNNSACKSTCLKCIKKLIAYPKMVKRLLSDPVSIPNLLGLISLIKSESHFKQEAAEVLALMVEACQYPEFLLYQGLQELQSEHSISLFLKLVASSEPQIKIQFLHLLVELSYKCEKARNLIQSNNEAVTHLFSSLQSDQQAVRRWAMKLIHCISEGYPDGVPLPPSPGKEAAVNTLATILTSSLDADERSIAAAIISQLPKEDNVVDEVLRKSETLKAIHEVICCTDREFLGMKTPASQSNSLLENALAALLRFTEPTKPELQRQVGKLELYPSLIRVLSTGSSTAKQRTAIALAQLSQSTSISVSNATTMSKQTNSMPMLQIMKLLPNMSWCCSASPENLFCSVHGSACSPRETFCLVKADAVKPLVQTLSDMESGVAEAALMALETLLMDHNTLSHAIAVIVDSQGVRAILQVLEKGSLSAKTKALDLLQKILNHTQISDLSSLRSETILIQLLDEDALRKKVALVLRQMGVIPEQSSYF